MKFLSRPRSAVVVAAASGLVGSAVAAVPEAVTTAITDMKVDASVVAVGVLLAIITVMAIKFVRRGM